MWLKLLGLGQQERLGTFNGVLSSLLLLGIHLNIVVVWRLHWQMEDIVSFRLSLLLLFSDSLHICHFAFQQ